MTHNLQIERVLDEINKQGTRYFKKTDLAGQKKEVTKAIHQYSKTGKIDFNPRVHEDDYDSETEFQEAYQRDTTLHATDFVVEPRSVIPQLHEKTLFKASHQVAQDVGTMKIKTKLFNKEFFEVIEVLKGNDPSVEKESTMQNTHQITDEDEIE